MQEKKMQQPILGQILIFFHFYDCAIANASLLLEFFMFFSLRQSFRVASTYTIFYQCALHLVTENILSMQGIEPLSLVQMVRVLTTTLIGH